jgi:hypothetical protein
MFTRRYFAFLGAVCALGICDPWSNASARPPARYGHSAVLDLAHNQMLVFGGNDGYDLYMNDVWALSLTGSPVWTQLAPAGTPPDRRASHSAVFDPVRKRMLVFGGISDQGPLSDVCVLEFAEGLAWDRLSPLGSGPSARSMHSAIYDPARDRVLVFGGLDGDGPRHDVWALTLSGTPAWTELAPSGTPPGDRFLHSAVYDPVRDRMLVFGGSNIFHFDNDCFALELGGATPHWASIAATGTPPVARDGSGAIYDPVADRMLIFGGWGNGIGPMNDVWSLLLAGAPAWTCVTTTGGIPTPRTLHSFMLDKPRNRLLVFGGTGSGDLASLDDTWALPLSGADLWSALVPGVDAPWAALAVNALRAPSPNPCHGRLAVSYTLAAAGVVRLGVYDVGGRLVRSLVDGERPAGTALAVWDGSGADHAPVGPGVYFLQLTGAGFREARRVEVLR